MKTGNADDGEGREEAGVLVAMLGAALPLWWAELQGWTCAELCHRAKELAWRFHGGEEDGGPVGGEGLAGGDRHGAARQFNALAEMLACVTMNEAAQVKPRPVRAFGGSWEYTGPIPELGTSLGAEGATGFEQCCGRLLGDWEGAGEAPPGAHGGVG